MCVNKQHNLIQGKCLSVLTNASVQYTSIHSAPGNVSTIVKQVIRIALNGGLSFFSCVCKKKTFVNIFLPLLFANMAANFIFCYGNTAPLFMMYFHSTHAY